MTEYPCRVCWQPCPERFGLCTDCERAARRKDIRRDWHPDGDLDQQRDRAWLDNLRAAGL